MTDAPRWIDCKRKADGVPFVAHFLGDRWRFAEKTDQRFPPWEVLPEAEFWERFEEVPTVEKVKKRWR